MYNRGQFAEQFEHTNYDFHITIIQGSFISNMFIWNGIILQ